MNTIYAIIENDGEYENDSQNVLYYGLSIEECEVWIKSKLPDFPARVYFARKDGKYSYGYDWYYMIKEIERVPQGVAKEE